MKKLLEYSKGNSDFIVIDYGEFYSFSIGQWNSDRTHIEQDADIRIPVSDLKEFMKQLNKIPIRLENDQ